MDAKRLDEIEARANRATAGPWYACDGADEGFDGSWDVAGPDNCGLAGMTATAPAAKILRDRQANAEFIAAARVDVPDLVAECRRLAAELAAARERLQGLWNLIARLQMDAESHPASALASLQSLSLADVAALSAAPAGEGDAFDRLADEWEGQTRNLSSPQQIAAHPNCDRIRAMGPAVVPRILARMRTRPWFWFALLRDLTGHDPVAPALYGDMEKMTDAWVAWGEERGLVPPAPAAGTERG